MTPTATQIRALLMTFTSIRLDGSAMIDWMGLEEYGIDEEDFNDAEPDTTLLTVYDRTTDENTLPMGSWELRELLEAEITADGCGLVVGDCELRFFTHAPLRVDGGASTVPMEKYSNAVNLLRRLMVGNYLDSIWRDVQEIVDNRHDDQ